MSTDSPVGPVYTTAEVAHMFRVSEYTVRQWRRDGLIAAAPLPGRVVRFTEAEVQRLAGAAAEGQAATGSWNREDKS